MGDSQTMVKKWRIESQVHLQNAAAVFIPFVVVFGMHRMVAAEVGAVEGQLRRAVRHLQVEAQRGR
jgi:hypothetical protein